MKYTVMFFLTLFFVRVVFATEPNIQIQARPDVIGINEASQISISVHQKALVSSPANSANFTLRRGGVSSSHNISFVNGRRSAITTFTYNFIFKPKKIGEITVGSFTVKIDGKTYKTKPFKIRVVKAAQHQQQHSQDPLNRMMDMFRGDERRIPEMSMELRTETGLMYKNQAIVVDAVVVSSDEKVCYSQFVETHPITAPKMVVYDISSSMKDEKAVQENINGETRYTRTIKRYVLYPLEEGSLSIRPPIFVAVTSYGQIKLTTPNVSAKIQKANFGAGLSYIGDLDIKKSISTNQIEVGKTVEVDFIMQGNGNLKLFSNPYNNLKIDGLYISAPKSKIEFVELKNSKAIFRQTLKYSILVQKAGEYSIPPIKIDYYGNRLNKRQITVDGFNLSVSSEALTANINKKYTLKQITKQNDFEQKNFVFLLHKPITIIALIVFALLPMLSLLYGRHSHRLSNDKNYARRFVANKRLSKYLQIASDYLNKKDYSKFYSELQKGILYYTTDKLGIASGIRIKKLLAELKNKDIDTELITLFKSVYDECNYNAYSGTTSDTTADDVLAKARCIFDGMK